MLVAPSDLPRRRTLRLLRAANLPQQRRRTPFCWSPRINAVKFAVFAQLSLVLLARAKWVERVAITATLASA